MNLHSVNKNKTESNHDSRLGKILFNPFKWITISDIAYKNKKEGPQQLLWYSKELGRLYRRFKK
jgi:hypothetical protein